MKAYAIRFCGEFWLVNAETAAKARGKVLISAFNADPMYRNHLKGLRCRRWPAFDGGGPRMDYWGVPGEWVDGARVEMPEPFANKKPGASPPGAGRDGPRPDASIAQRRRPGWVPIAKSNGHTTRSTRGAAARRSVRGASSATPKR